MVAESDDSVPETNAPRSNPIADIGVYPAPSAQQVSLEDLIRLAGPLATAYFDQQERAHQREIAYDTEVLHAEVSWRRTILRSGTILAIAVFAIAGVLFYQSRDAAALDLIKLVVAVAGAAFGGYGVARGRDKPRGVDE